MKSPGDMRRLAVTQTPVKDHQLTLVQKTRKGVSNNSNIDYTTKWYMENPDPVRENETQKILFDFEIKKIT